MCRSDGILYHPSLPFFNFSSSLQSHTMLVRNKERKKRHNERPTSLQQQDELSFQIILDIIVESDEM